MNRIFYLLIFFFLLESCTSKTIYPKPKDLIPKDTMSLLLKDLFLANAAKNIKNIHLQRKVNYHPLVYQKFKIDSARFVSSNFYYISRIDDYEDVLTKIVTEIEQEQEELIHQKKVRDSLKKIKRDEAKKNVKVEEAIKKVPSKKIKKLKS